MADRKPPKSENRPAADPVADLAHEVDDTVEVAPDVAAEPSAATEPHDTVPVDPLERDDRRTSEIDDRGRPTVVLWASAHWQPPTEPPRDRETRRIAEGQKRWAKLRDGGRTQSGASTTLPEPIDKASAQGRATVPLEPVATPRDSSAAGGVGEARAATAVEVERRTVEVPGLRTATPDVATRPLVVTPTPARPTRSDRPAVATSEQTTSTLFRPGEVRLLGWVAAAALVLLAGAYLLGRWVGASG